jgi:hypothetical protein
MTSIIVCGVPNLPISEWDIISIGAPLSAGRRGPDWSDFVATIDVAGSIRVLAGHTVAETAFPPHLHI